MKSRIVRSSRILILIKIALITSVFNANNLFSQCAGLVDAGPDLFTCDPTMMIQLQGMINGTPNKFEWIPSTGLSDPKALDPMVLTKIPGRYKYTLSAEVIGTTNLILNGNFEAGFSGFSTEYVFRTLGQGFGPDNVAIATNPQAYNSGFQNCGDHTSGSGNMWLVDGSTAAGKKVWCQTVPTVPGKMYQFELYSMLVFPNSPSIIGITVNGASIGGGQVGALCDWTLMTACFTATSASSTICISELTGVGFGNDFALDDLALYEKCVDEDEVEVEIVDLKAVVIIPFKPKCSSEVFDLFGTGSSTGSNITYQWSTDVGEIVSQNGLVAKGKGSGTYTLKVIYKNGNTLCETEASIDYEAPEKLEGTIQSLGLANCALDTIDLRVLMNTGSGDYTYDWSPSTDILVGSKSDLAKVFKAQTYKVTITDINTGCKLELLKSISADTILPDFNLTGDTLINCVRKNAILLSSLQDTSLYSIIWTLPDNQKINDASTLQSSQSGNYILKITNKLNKCFNAKSINVKIDTSTPVTSAQDTLNIDCINNSAVIIPSGNNSSDVKYYWSFPDGRFLIDDTIRSRTSIIPGFVVIRSVNEKNGCQDIDTVHIRDIRKFPTISINASPELNCIRKSVDLNANTNSTNNLSIQWSTLSGNIISGANQINAKADKKGIYYIRLLDTINNCEIFDSIEIRENISLPIVNAGPDLVFQCKDSLLSIDASLSSSGANFQYDWSTTNGIIGSGNGTQKLEIRQSGSYKLVITDITNGCKDSVTIKVSPDANKPLLNTVPPNKLTCSNKSAILQANATSQTGNTLTFQWVGDNNQNISNSNSTQASTGSPGKFTIVVTDSGNGCSSSAIINVDIDTTAPGANAGVDLVLNCAINEFTITGTSNSIMGIIYNWSTLNGTIVSTSDPKTIKATSPATYILTSIDGSNGCISIDSMSIRIDTTRPMFLLLNPDTLTCLKTQLTISGTNVGGSSKYLWSTGNGNIIGPISNPNILVNKKGIYSLTVTDTSNQCFLTRTVEVIEDINPPIISIATPIKLTCKILSVNLDLNIANSSNSSILWTTNTGNIISGSNQLNPTVSAEAWYTVRVIGENGCVTIDSVFVSEIKNVPTNLITNLTQPNCPDDISALNSLVIQGGEGPYTYFIDGNSITQFPLSNLSPGLHDVKIIDKNGCEFSSNFIINTPSAIDVMLPADLKINEGTDITLQFSSTTPADSIASIEWQPAEKLSCSNCPNPTTRNLDDENIFTVLITNKNGCTATADIRINLIKKGFWVPNAFSPNGDGINDIFHPEGVEEAIKSISTFQIYDRWGALMYRNDNIPGTDLKRSGWNGMFNNQSVNPGVYTYMIIVEWNSGEKQNFLGDITVVR
ncbi:MAG: T9SS type B sorting domain-containing protein [Saprospiraceae bacterium]|nr:T9SS type B sorting domain-containing protein [Saprospiraceae bacterium]